MGVVVQIRRLRAPPRRGLAGLVLRGPEAGQSDLAPRAPRSRYALPRRRPAGGHRRAGATRWPADTVAVGDSGVGVVRIYTVADRWVEVPGLFDRNAGHSWASSLGAAGFAGPTGRGGRGRLGDGLSGMGDFRSNSAVYNPRVAPSDCRIRLGRSDCGANPLRGFDRKYWKC